MEFDLHITKLLIKALEDVGSWRELQTQIGNVNGSKESTVDRRKLRKLCSDSAASTPLTINELKFLQEFFISRGEIRLRDNMIFSRPKMVLDGFANETNATILLPTRFSEKANVEMSSRWDLRAVEILLAAPELRDERKVSLSGVFHYGAEIRGQQLLKAVEKEKWQGIVNGANAVISIGCPFVNYATESLLCEMVGVKTRFEPMPNSAKLPFRFFWKTQNYMSNSAFAFREEPITGLSDQSLRELNEIDRGLLVGDDWYPAHRYGDSTNLVVAQFKHGRLRIVLCGIFAPATLGLAQQLVEGQIPLHISEKKNHLLVATVESRIGESRFEETPTGAGIKRDRRKLESMRFKEVRIWNTDTSDWENSEVA